MLNLYNTLSHRKEKFRSINTGKVGMYVCGPTVYDYIHIGNIRSYLTVDILRRYLEYLGFETRMIKNITDVGHLTQDDIAQADSGEDKLLKKALAEKKTPREIAKFYENYFHATEEKMNILPAHYFPKATAHINQMIKIIEILINKGYAYVKNGNVFFDIAKFPEYGLLSGNTLEKLKIGARLDAHPDKKNPWDFALWLKAPKKHLMRWTSPWGEGYPGWHIECSAMSTEYLGETIDIHTGGEDNIFPHHEAEIAQSQCFTGKKFVNFWVHTRHLLVDGEKMSKSKGNFYTLEDIEKKGFSPMELRLLLLSSHYRSPLNFTWQAMEQAKKNLRKITDFIRDLENLAKEKKTETSTASFPIKKFQEKFESVLNDDLNTPLALTILYELITETNKLISEKKINPTEAKNILNLWQKMNRVFGLFLPATEIPQEIKIMAEKRKETRDQKDFARADEIRKEIEAKGWLIEDNPSGYILKRK